MLVYNFTNECLQRDYRGCGKAWAAIDDSGNVTLLRYMDAAPAATRQHKPATEFYNAQRREFRQRGMTAISRHARESGKWPTAIAFARDFSDETIGKKIIDRETFAAYRLACRAECEAVGRLVSGMASCTKFCCP